MTGNGNGTHNGNGQHRWWQIWKGKGKPDISAYQRLALQLHFGLPRSDSASRSVLLVSPNESHLCAVGSLTLASCMADELQRRVLLIDATVSSAVGNIVLQNPAAPGLTDFLADPLLTLQSLVQPTNQPNVWFLSRGTFTGASVPGSPENAHDLLVRAANQWDFIIVAGGAVLQNSLTLSMAPWVGRVLLLVAENRTYTHDITAAQNALELCKARNVSLVMTEPTGRAR